MSLHYDAIRVLDNCVLIDRELNLHSYQTQTGQPLKEGVYLVIWKGQTKNEGYGPDTTYVGPLDVSTTSNQTGTSLYQRVLECLAERRISLEASIEQPSRLIC